MKISATKVVEVPQTVIDQQRRVSGSMPPPPAPPADVPILVAEEAPAPQQVAAAEPAPAALPKTASQLPLIGFLGMLSLASWFGMKALRSKSGD
jgi:hypothetical protein